MKWMDEWPISHLLTKEDVQLCPFCTKQFFVEFFFLLTVAKKITGKG